MPLIPPLLLLALACGDQDPDAYLVAMDPGTPDAAALLACGRLAGERADECTAAVVRAREGLDATACAAIGSDRWADECHFVVAERLAAAGQRWDALRGCGRAGRFQDECLYHAWTRELQRHVRAALDQEGGTAPGDAPDPAPSLAAAEESIAFWEQLETAGPDQESRLWNDFWYLWWLHHRPARTDACDLLPEPHRPRCAEGTAGFVERAITERLDPAAAPDLVDRVCRAEALPAFLLDDTARREPLLEAAAARARERACAPGEASPRPWNPIFQPRRTR